MFASAFFLLLALARVDAMGCPVVWHESLMDGYQRSEGNTGEYFTIEYDCWLCMTQNIEGHPNVNSQWIDDETGEWIGSSATEFMFYAYINGLPTLRRLTIFTAGSPGYGPQACPEGSSVGSGVQCISGRYYSDADSPWGSLHATDQWVPGNTVYLRSCQSEYCPYNGTRAPTSTTTRKIGSTS